MKFSKNIKKFRIAAELTQEQLANRLGVSPQAVSKWENSGTYPDAALLVPIANTLGVSLDCLFANDKIYDSDTARRLYETLKHTQRDGRMDKVLDFCLHMEKALFGDEDNEWNPDDRYHGSVSHIDTDRGFTYVSGDAPFFAVFPESADGRRIDECKVRNVFEILGDSDVMSAVLFLLKSPREYTFEACVLARECGFSVDSIADVMEKLEQLKLVTKKDVSINGKAYTLYSYTPRCDIMMLMITAGEIGYSGRHRDQADLRSGTYLK